MNQLANALERFNRKERNLVIRDILDCLDRTPPLGPVFCKRLAKATEISEELLECAWWATDFHFDWLAGALLSFMKGETQTRQCNRSMTIELGPESKTNVRLVMGNQEDIDLVIVAHDPVANMYHLILIEAKAYSHHNGKQSKRKIGRFQLLYELYIDLKTGSRQEGEPTHNVTFYYLPFSQKKPSGDHFARRLPLESNAVTNSDHTHLELMFPESSRRPASSILTVTRCKNDDLQSREGTYWKCGSLQSRRRPGTPEQRR